jgi:hypothetical protein
MAHARSQAVNSRIARVRLKPENEPGTKRSPPRREPTSS